MDHSRSLYCLTNKNCHCKSRVHFLTENIPVQIRHSNPTRHEEKTRNELVQRHLQKGTFQGEPEKETRTCRSIAFFFFRRTLIIKNAELTSSFNYYFHTKYRAYWKSDCWKLKCFNCVWDGNFRLKNWMYAIKIKKRKNVFPFLSMNNCDFF